MFTGELLAQSPRRVEPSKRFVERGIDLVMFRGKSVANKHLGNSKATLHSSRSGISSNERVPEIKSDRVEPRHVVQRFRMTPSRIAASAAAAATSGAIRLSNTEGMT